MTFACSVSVLPTYLNELSTKKNLSVKCEAMYSTARTNLGEKVVREKE